MSKHITSWVGIDNGVTGSIGIVYMNGTHAFLETPVIKVCNYTKIEKHIHRINWKDLAYNIPINSFVLLERPMVDPMRFTATTSALRALEATLIALEMRGFVYGVDYDYIDSKEWQREFLSSAVIGSKEHKKASMEVGLTLFPSNAGVIRKHGDADGLLIAQYARNKYLKDVHS
jgi:hypothetical protein